MSPAGGKGESYSSKQAARYEAELKELRAERSLREKKLASLQGQVDSLTDSGN